MYLKLSKLLERISFKLKQQALYFELKHYIKNKKTYFKTVHYYTRGIGKTYTLIKLAKKFKCPIVVPNKAMEGHIQSLCKKFKIKNIEVIICGYPSKGKKYDLILCEEGLDFKLINEVLKPMSKCLVGFIGDKENFKKEYECIWIEKND